MTKRKLQIGIIGYAGLEEYPDNTIKKEIYEIAERVGFLVAQKGAIVVTGGKGGVMESAASGARKAGGTTVGIIKGSKRFESNNFTDIEVLTGMQANGFDELMLVLMCDALIVFGGGAGTLEEITIAYRNKKPIIVMKNTGGWADKINNNFLDERKTVKAEVAATPEEAIEKTFSLIKT